MNHHATLTTAIGPLTIMVDESGLVQAAGFAAEPAELLPAAARPASRRLGDLGDITKAVLAYLDGDLARLAEPAVAQPPAGGGFVATARRMLRTIPPGATCSYTGLAAAAGRPAAVRAAGSACSGNLIALLVPCHRVLRGDGGLGGYRWGLARKRWLLRHERRYLPDPVAAGGQPAGQLAG